MKIGLIGLTYCSGNKGCEALSYSFLEVLNRIAKENNISITASLITIFPTRLWLKQKCSFWKTKKNYLPAVSFSNVESECIFYKPFGRKIIFESGFKDFDCVFDFTAGDSFTDIYGEERFYKVSLLKSEVIRQGMPLILGSQTIGPFKNPEIERIAARIIREATEVYVRDQLSYDYTKEITGRVPLITTDIAFVLPFEQQQKSKDGKRVGFNPSGLLWNGGYTRNNQFGLTVDYKEYCRNVISQLLSDGKEVHLILHAYSKDLSKPDNDLIAVQELHKEFPLTIVSPEFANPMEAKGYISGMDLFIGARMHATIAAFSVGVPVLPFSYSRKFEGLFNSLNYDCIIHGCEDSTNEAVKKTLDWASKLDELKEKMSEGELLVQKQTEFLVKSYENIIKKCSGVCK